MTDNTELVLERTIDAPRDLVWKAFTSPEHLKQWFAPRPYQISECELDLKPGGIFRIRMVGPDGFDTVTWVAEQPWCDGNVGMAGGSYFGATRWRAA